MGMPYPKYVPKVSLAGAHIARISHAGNNRANYLSGCETPSERANERIFGIVMRIFHILYYILNKPAWIWQNFCYKEGPRYVPMRFIYLCAYLVERTDIGDILNINRLSHKSKKALFFLKRPNPP
jgi:hypothetical protein